MAPATIASSHAPPAEIEGAASCCAPARQQPSREGVAGQHAQEDQSLQHGGGGMRNVEPALQQAAACRDAAEQQRHQDDGQCILPRQETRPGCRCSPGRRRGIRWRRRAPRRSRWRRRPRRLRRPGSRRAGSSRPIGRPAICAARRLPPRMSIEKPSVVWRRSRCSSRQTTRPMTRPQCTDQPGMLPIMKPFGIDQLCALRVCEKSRIGPLTRWLSSAMAM